MFQAFGPLGNGRELLTDPVLVEISESKKKTTAQVGLPDRKFYFNANDNLCRFVYGGLGS